MSMMNTSMEKMSREKMSRENMNREMISMKKMSMEKISKEKMSREKMSREKMRVLRTFGTSHFVTAVGTKSHQGGTGGLACRQIHKPHRAGRPRNIARMRFQAQVVRQAPIPGKRGWRLLAAEGHLQARTRRDVSVQLGVSAWS